MKEKQCFLFLISLALIFSTTSDALAASSKSTDLTQPSSIELPEVIEQEGLVNALTTIVLAAFTVAFARYALEYIKK